MKKIVASLMILGVALSMLLVGAIALFTDSETNPTNSFSAGTLDLAIDPATAMFTVTDMAPSGVEYSGLQVTGPDHRCRDRCRC